MSSARVIVALEALDVLRVLLYGGRNSNQSAL